MKSLEEEISQEKFSSEFQKAVLNISVTANVIRAASARFLKNYGVSAEQYNVLRILRGQKGKPASILLIQERMMDKSSNASRLVDKLELKELVTRKQCPSDRRQVEVGITEKGLALLAEIDKPLAEMENAAGLVPEKDLKSVNEILNIIRNHYTKEK
jgi:DNA-binding MarR family transcriptional regulator